MLDQKQYRKAKRMQGMVRFFMGLKGKPHAAVRFIKTSQGDIRVLEYGFDSDAVKPLFIDLHGGGFVLMTADSDDQINQYLLGHTNARIVSIDYPKAPDHPFPAALDAAYEVVAYYFAHADALHIDAAHIGIGGHSAGANLAAAICMRARQQGTLALRYQLLDYPPLDLYTNPSDKRTPKQSTTTKMAGMFNAAYVDAQQARNPFASPVFATQDMLRDLPPALMIIAGLDALHDEGAQYADMLLAAGVDVSLHDFPDADHGFTLSASEDTTRALGLMAEFITRHSTPH